MTRPLAAAAFALALTGCIRFGPEPPDQLLRLTPAQALAAGSGSTAAPGQAITVLTPSLPQELNNTRVPVHATDTTVAYVPDATWTDTPNRLFQQLLSDVIAARTGRPVVAERQFVFDPGVRVSGRLQMFGVDAASQSAVVTFDAVMNRGEALQTRRFEARVPVTAIEPIPVGAALNQAANQVAAQVADWIGSS